MMLDISDIADALHDIRTTGGCRDSADIIEVLLAEEAEPYQDALDAVRRGMGTAALADELEKMVCGGETWVSLKR